MALVLDNLRLLEDLPSLSVCPSIAKFAFGNSFITATTSSNFLVTPELKEDRAELNKIEIPLADRNTYGKAFLQFFNLWRTDEKIKEGYVLSCQSLPLTDSVEIIYE